MNVPGVLTVRCHYCSRQRPAWQTHQVTGAQRICDSCLEWHNKAIEFLAGHSIPGCQGCGATWELLRDREPESVEVRLYVVPKDGIYQVLCRGCVRPYVSARSDLYRDTRFGASMKI